MPSMRMSAPPGLRSGRVAVDVAGPVGGQQATLSARSCPRGQIRASHALIVDVGLADAGEQVIPVELGEILPDIAGLLSKFAK